MDISRATRNRYTFRKKNTTCLKCMAIQKEGEKMRIEIFEGKDGQWYYRLRSTNGQILCTSEGYTRSYDAWRGATRLRLYMKTKNVPIIEM